METIGTTETNYVQPTNSLSLENPTQETREGLLEKINAQKATLQDTLSKVALIVECYPEESNKKDFWEIENDATTSLAFADNVRRQVMDLKKSIKAYKRYLPRK